jgi:hypothetical protein
MSANPTISSDAIPNGSGAAALLAAGVGSFVLAVVAIAADHIAAIKGLMVFSKPTGPISGVTTTAVVVWLAVWAILEGLWRKKNVGIGRIGVAALVLLALALLLTFPPVGDLF